MLSEALQAITEEEMRTGNNLTPCSLCAVSLLCNIAKEERKKYTKYQLNMFELSICSSATFEEQSPKSKESRPYFSLHKNNDSQLHKKKGINDKKQCQK